MNSSSPNSVLTFNVYLESLFSVSNLSLDNRMKDPYIFLLPNVREEKLENLPKHNLHCNYPHQRRAELVQAWSHMYPYVWMLWCKESCSFGGGEICMHNILWGCSQSLFSIVVMLFMESVLLGSLCGESENLVLSTPPHNIHTIWTSSFIRLAHFSEQLQNNKISKSS